MTISIRPVTRHNWRDLIALEAKPAQQGFIESNAVSLLESFYDRSLYWRCCGLYDKDIPAGFMMYGARTLWHRDIWLDRFMLDASWQGAGHSKRFLSACIDHIGRKFWVKRIRASIVPGNEAAHRLFISQGFEDTGLLDPEFNERVYVLTLP